MGSSRNGRMFGLTVVAAVALVLAGVLASSGQTSAGTGPKVIRGWVWDIDGRNVTGASIVVNIWEDSSKAVLSATLGEPTDEDGFYSLQFAPEDWEIGYYVEVISTYNGDQEPNGTDVTASPFQYVNITYDYGIPEFGSVIGLVVAGGAIGLVAIVALFATQRRRIRA
jgi:hypothetical protein